MVPPGNAAKYLNEKDLHPTDILLGKGKYCSRHIGTTAFKALVEASLSTYMNEATESCDKTFMTVEIVETIHADGGRFLKETKTGLRQWFELDKKEAREKVRYALCNAAKSKKRQRPPGGSSAALAMKRFTSQLDKQSSFFDIVSKLKENSVDATILETSKIIKQFTKTANKSKSNESDAKFSQLPHLSLPPADGGPQLARHHIDIMCTNTRPVGGATSLLLPRPEKLPFAPPSMQQFSLQRAKLSSRQAREIVVERKHYSSGDIRRKDILVGRSKHCNLGTIAFKILINVNVTEYVDKATKSCEKTFMTVEMVETIARQGGRFLKETAYGSGVWLEIDKREAREKVRQAFRDAFITQRIERPGTLLAKIKFSSTFEKENTFSDILGMIGRDPAVERFLSTDNKLIKADARRKPL